MYKQEVIQMDSLRKLLKTNARLTTSELAVMLDMDEKLIREKASKIRFDPQTGKMYRIGSKKAIALDEEVTQRLIPRMQDSEERLNKRIEVWKKVSSELGFKKVLVLNGEEKKKKICELIEDAVGYNS